MYDGSGTIIIYTEVLRRSQQMNKEPMELVSMLLQSSCG